MTEEARREAQALLTRGAHLEAQRQSAIARSDFHAVREIEIEQSRLWARYLDLEQMLA